MFLRMVLSENRRPLFGIMREAKLGCNRIARAVVFVRSQDEPETDDGNTA